MKETQIISWIDDTAIRIRGTKNHIAKEKKVKDHFHQ